MVNQCVQNIKHKSGAEGGESCSSFGVRLGSFVTFFYLVHLVHSVQFSPQCAIICHSGLNTKITQNLILTEQSFGSRPNNSEADQICTNLYSN